MLAKTSTFTYPSRGEGRPQIVLYGNGLERGGGQPDWYELLRSLRAPGVEELKKDDRRRKIPFPLLYQLLSTPEPAPSTLNARDIDGEEGRLREGLAKLVNSRISLLDRLSELNADHIFTTNYSYCLEKSFWPRRDFSSKYGRSRARLYLLSKDDRPVREIEYRLHTCYLGSNSDGSDVGLWHIHGESSVPRGVVIGHDRYGRLLRRIQDCLPASRYLIGRPGIPIYWRFTSWPELFLFGDVYVVGFGFDTCEYDLWWLLRRKQRERYADGRVYFFDNDDDGSHPLRDSLLAAHGVVMNPRMDKTPGDYDAFYQAALGRIEEMIGTNKARRS